MKELSVRIPLRHKRLRNDSLRPGQLVRCTDPEDSNIWRVGSINPKFPRQRDLIKVAGTGSSRRRVGISGDTFHPVTRRDERLDRTTRSLTMQLHRKAMNAYRSRRPIVES